MLAHERHVQAVAFSIHSSIHLFAGYRVLEAHAVAVPRIHSVVVVGFVLDYWVVPAIADQDSFEINVVRALERAGVDEFVLLDDVSVLISLHGTGRARGRILLIEHGSVMSTIALSRKMKARARVLWKCSHEPLERFPHAWCSIPGRICRVCWTWI